MPPPSAGWQKRSTGCPPKLANVRCHDAAGNDVSQEDSLKLVIVFRLQESFNRSPIAALISLLAIVTAHLSQCDLWMPTHFRSSSIRAWIQPLSQRCLQEASVDISEIAFYIFYEGFRDPLCQ